MAPAEMNTGTIEESAFLPILARRLGPLVAIQHLVERTKKGGDRARRAFSEIAQLAQDLSTLLDDYGARTNQCFAPLAEYVAGFRGFAQMGRHLVHLVSRLGAELPQPLSDSQAFSQETARTLEFVDFAMSNLHGEIVAEANRLLGEGTTHPTPSSSQTTTGMSEIVLGLPHDIEEESVPQQERWVSEIASKFLAHLQILKRQSRGERFDDAEAMRTFVLEVSDEQQVRFFRTRIMNLLSRYDTYVGGTQLERDDEDLPRFRSHVVVALHILEIMIEQVHFYERHENDVRSEKAKNRIAQLVDKERLLDRVLNYCLFNLHIYMDQAAPIASSLVDRFTRQTEVQLQVPVGIDLHARPVSYITRVVSHFGTPVKMKIGDAECYAGSMLEMLMAVGRHPSERSVTFVGDHAPLEHLEMLFAASLGETDVGLPKELAYLGG